MEPYQEAAQATRRSGETPIKALKYGAGIALGTGASVVAKNAITKMLPLLNSVVPQSFAKKALGKIDPRIGSFMRKAEDEGFDFNEIKDFLSEKINKTEESQKAKENRNIIEQESPELHKFIDQEIRKGRKPIEAGAIAQNDKRFSNVINNLMKKHKTSWSSIIESIFGGGDQALSQNQTGEPGQPPQNKAQAAWQAFNQSHQPGKAPNGPGAQALMDILSKVNQKLGQ